MNLEWELDPDGKRTGRWRKRQFYALPGPEGLVHRDKRPPSFRTPCEWRNPLPR